MEYTFVSHRQLSFIVTTGGRNLLVSFGNRNQSGVAVFMTTDDKVAHAIRRHSLSRRGIIEETTKPTTVQTPVEKPAAKTAQMPPTPKKKDKPMKVATEKPDEGENEERVYDNYTVARESICKEFGAKKSEIRNPNTLAKFAKEHGIIIKYKEL